MHWSVKLHNQCLCCMLTTLWKVKIHKITAKRLTWVKLILMKYPGNTVENHILCHAKSSVSIKVSSCQQIFGATFHWNCTITTKFTSLLLGRDIPWYVIIMLYQDNTAISNDIKDNVSKSTTATILSPFQAMIVSFLERPPAELCSIHERAALGRYPDR